MRFVAAETFALGLGGDVSDLKFRSAAFMNSFENLVVLRARGKYGVNAQGIYTGSQ